MKNGVSWVASADDLGLHIESMNRAGFELLTVIATAPTSFGAAFLLFWKKDGQ